MKNWLYIPTCWRKEKKIICSSSFGCSLVILISKPINAAEFFHISFYSENLQSFLNNIFWCGLSNLKTRPIYLLTIFKCEPFLIVLILIASKPLKSNQQTYMPNDNWQIKFSIFIFGYMKCCFYRIPMAMVYE
jgi:hypothetical protein